MRGQRYQRGVWALAAPFLVGSLLLVLGPAVVTAGYAFTEFDAIDAPRWVGLDNFRALPTYVEFGASVRATLILLAIAVPLRVLGGLGLALLLHRRERLAATGRVAAYLPVVTPDPATALVVLWLVNPVFGPVGVLAGSAGFDGALLLDPWGARLTIAAVSVLALGEGFLVTLAARRELPGSLYEVARAEGAGPVRTFRHVTLPLLAPVLALVAARDLVVSMQVVLVPTLLLTRGGPLNATKTLPVLAYERGFRELRLGDAAAIAVVLLVVTAVLVAVQARLLRRYLRAGRTD
jgi:multiple sugar transport system permease protein